MMSHEMKVLTSLCLLVGALGTTPPPIETPPAVYPPFELSSSDLCQRECKKTVVVNFESTFMAGDIVGELSDVNGVDVMPMGTCNIKVNAQSAGGGKGSPSGVVPPDIFQNSAMIFDSTCGNGTSADCSGGDDDLFVPLFENTLIISEDRDQSDPDDASLGGILNFDFSDCLEGTLDVCSLVVIDFERAFDGRRDLNITALTASGPGPTLVAEDFSNAMGVVVNAGNGEVNRLTLGFEDATGMRISTTDSGAFDEIVLCQVFEGCDIHYWKKYLLCGHNWFLSPKTKLKDLIKEYIGDALSDYLEPGKYADVDTEVMTMSDVLYSNGFGIPIILYLMELVAAFLNIKSPKVHYHLDTLGELIAFHLSAKQSAWSEATQSYDFQLPSFYEKYLILKNWNTNYNCPLEHEPKDLWGPYTGNQV